MRCAYHPDRNAVAECSQCKRPLCEECAAADKGAKLPVCGRCLILTAAEDAAQVLDERKEKREERRRAMDLKGRRKKRLLPILTAALAAVVLATNLFLYLSSEDLPAEPFDPSRDPILTATLINIAIQDYAQAHAGQFPQSLLELREGDYLPSEKMTEVVFKGFSYTRSSPHAYELRIREEAGGDFSDIVFTQEDRQR